MTRASSQWASAYIAKSGSSKGVAYCARSEQEALRSAKRVKDIAVCAAVARGANCKTAKLAAQKAARAKCKPCRFFDTEFISDTKWAVVERLRGGKRQVIKVVGKGKPAMALVERLSRQYCPKGMKFGK